MNDPEECFAYAEHLHHEHGRLNRLLLEIGQKWRSSVGRTRPVIFEGGWKAGSLICVISSRRTLPRKKTAVAWKKQRRAVPASLTTSKTVLEEHPVLDRLLCTLLAQLSEPATTPAEIQASWRTFYTKIQCHEAAETRLLQMAFGSGAADLDVEGDA